MSKATYDTDGLSGAFSKDNMNNQFHSLYQGDSAPLRPRAQAAPNMTIAVTSAIAESFYGNIWLNNIASATYAGGNSSAISAPSANPRIDLLYLNSAGALAWLTGVEAGAPAAPSFAGYAGIPICLVYCKTTMTKIVNYEDTGANPNEGYIYKDIRPQIVPILDIASLTEKTALLADDLLVIEDSAASNVKKKVKFSNATKIVQVVSTETGAVSTGTTLMPIDDTLPQITEGDEFMTLAITPTSATNKLKIDIVCHLANDNTNGVVAALFQDATASALAVGFQGMQLNNQALAVVFTYTMIAGTTSETTFRIRGGSSGGGGTTTFNGQSEARLFGGVLASSIIITEISV